MIRFPLPERAIAWPIVALALILLNASLTFANVWPTPAIRWQNALSIELAVCVLVLTAFHGRPAWLRAGLPAVWLLLVIGRYLDVTGPAIYGRDFNFYWDAPHLGNVAAMIAEAAPTWQIVLAVAGAIVAVATAYALSRVAWGVVADAAMRGGGMRASLTTTAAVMIALFAAKAVFGEPPPGVVFAEPVTAEYLHQGRSMLSIVGPGSVAPTLGASPDALQMPPSGLAGADVYLVFVESYGAITFDEPEIAAALGPARAALDMALRDTGRHAVSGFVESPTFGASSWLAHLTMMSGIKIDDQYSYQTLMAQQRDTLSTTFKSAGYRAVALMPGMRQAWPEGAFYQYDEIYGRDALAYSGPRFGWWSIPDQYSLAKLDAVEGPAPSRAPLFVVFPTSTTHAPFGPVAPYQPDWNKVLQDDAYDPREVEEILARRPDLTNLRGDYANAMAYEFITLAGYLRHRGSDDLVLILVGDHQPPAAVSGLNAPWTVPVHVITGKAHVAERLQRRGFQTGTVPSRPVLGEMHELVPMLLDAFQGSGIRGGAESGG